MINSDALMRYVPGIVGLACIIWGWIGLGAQKVPIRIRWFFWEHRTVLKGKAITFLSTSLVLLGILILGFVAANILFFDRGGQTETMMNGYPEPVSTTSARIWIGTLCFVVPYMFVSMNIAVWINHRYEEEKQKVKRMPKPKRKRGFYDHFPY